MQPTLFDRPPAVRTSPRRPLVVGDVSPETVPLAEPVTAHVPPVSRSVRAKLTTRDEAVLARILDTPPELRPRESWPLFFAALAERRRRDAARVAQTY